SIMSLIWVLLVTGIIMWRPYFAQYFPIPVIRGAMVVHAIAAILLIHAILVHIYSAFWVKGSIKGMIEGKVSRKWAQKHHPRWYRQVAAEEEQQK
ncbi:MAG: formate dehydrogenase cytochrome b556 subunit, partial [Enterobacteriaceae bacterium]